MARDASSPNRSQPPITAASGGSSADDVSRKPSGRGKSDGDGVSALAKGYAIAWQFMGSLLVMTGIGFALDRQANSLPLGTVVGFFLGLTSGMYVLIKNLKVGRDG